MTDSTGETTDPNSQQATRAHTRRRFIQGATGLVGVGLAGCSSGQSPDPTTTENDDGGTASTTATDTTQTTQALESNTTIGLSMDPTRDYFSVHGGVTPYYTNVLEPLIWVNDDMSLEPWLATDWTATGEKTWEFSLREDVTFHNGEPLTADAVVFSFREILNEWSFAPAWLHVKPENVTKLDESTVEFETTDPFPAFPGTITHNVIAIQHPDRSRAEKEVIGTGAFRVVEQKEDQYVKVEAFEDYWNGPPKPEQLTFRSITDPNTRALALESGEVDIAFDPPTNKLQLLEESEDLVIEQKPQPRATMIGCNLYRSPTDDVRLRRALNYAVDQEVIVESVLNGIGEPARGPIAESIYWSGHDSLPEYAKDTSKATQLVEESSYAGEPLTLIVDMKNPVDGKLIAQVVQQAAADIGVTIEIQVLEKEAYYDSMIGGEAHLVLRNLGTKSGAADYIIYQLLHSKGSDNERMYKEEGTGVFNPGDEVDALIEKGFQTPDSDRKEAAYEEALQITMDEAVYIPINYNEYVVGMATDIEGADLRTIPQMSRWTELEHTA